MADFDKLAIHRAASRGDLGCLRRLCKGNDFFKCDDYLRTPLHFACAGGRVDVVDYLLKKGAAVSSRDKNGRTPLHDACESGEVQVVALLLDNKASLESCDNENWTPLHVACWRGHLPIVMLLCSNNANISARDNRHRTPLHICCFGGHADTAHYLIQQGANTSTLDDEENVPGSVFDGEVSAARQSDVKSIFCKEISMGDTSFQFLSHRGGYRESENFLGNQKKRCHELSHKTSIKMTSKNGPLFKSSASRIINRFHKPSRAPPVSPVFGSWERRFDLSNQINSREDGAHPSVKRSNNSSECADTESYCSQFQQYPTADGVLSLPPPNCSQQTDINLVDPRGNPDFFQPDCHISSRGLTDSDVNTKLSGSINILNSNSGVPRISKFHQFSKIPLLNQNVITHGDQRLQAIPTNQSLRNVYCKQNEPEQRSLASSESFCTPSTLSTLSNKALSNSSITNCENHDKRLEKEKQMKCRTYLPAEPFMMPITRVMNPSILDVASPMFAKYRHIGIGKRGEALDFHGRVYGVEVFIKLVNMNTVINLMNATSFRHQNIMPLLGVCLDEKFPAVIYPHMQNRSLEYQLRSEEGRISISWMCRLSILTQYAKALLYICGTCTKERPYSVTQSPITCRQILLHSDWTARLLLIDPLQFSSTSKIADRSLFLRAMALNVKGIGNIITELLTGTLGTSFLSCFNNGTYVSSDDLDKYARWPLSVAQNLVTIAHQCTCDKRISVNELFLSLESLLFKCSDGSVTLAVSTDEYYCSICLSQPRETCFFPCAHSLACRECASYLYFEEECCPVNGCVIKSIAYISPNSLKNYDSDS